MCAKPAVSSVAGLPTYSQRDTGHRSLKFLFREQALDTPLCKMTASTFQNTQGEGGYVDFTRLPRVPPEREDILRYMHVHSFYILCLYVCVINKIISVTLSLLSAHFKKLHTGWLNMKPSPFCSPDYIKTEFLSDFALHCLSQGREGCPSGEREEGWDAGRGQHGEGPLPSWCASVSAWRASLQAGLGWAFLVQSPPYTSPAGINGNMSMCSVRGSPHSVQSHGLNSGNGATFWYWVRGEPGQGHMGSLYF